MQCSFGIYPAMLAHRHSALLSPLNDTRPHAETRVGDRTRLQNPSAEGLRKVALPTASDAVCVSGECPPCSSRIGSS